MSLAVALLAAVGCTSTVEQTVAPTPVGVGESILTAQSRLRPTFTASCDPFRVCTFTDTTRESGALIVARVWDFGDGSAPGSGPVAVHQYSQDGRYAVTLTVTDAGNNVGSTTRNINIKWRVTG